MMLDKGKLGRNATQRNVSAKACIIPNRNCAPTRSKAGRVWRFLSTLILQVILDVWPTSVRPNIYKKAKIYCPVNSSIYWFEASFDPLTLRLGGDQVYAVCTNGFSGFFFFLFRWRFLFRSDDLWCFQWYV